jgi:hypothetical protein
LGIITKGEGNMAEEFNYQNYLNDLELNDNDSIFSHLERSYETSYDDDYIAFTFEDEGDSDE